ncbi:MAG: YkgJ family cysteine cluster protein [Desulfobulbaceae bacterium]|jgi:Fe-S-cluster containining protein|nr:YkgJ family cysteine cluster protein [Desulfobulbaceae bacterium]
MGHLQLPEHIKEISDQESFTFNCHPGVACFTDCCHQLELALTPYDVVRLRKKLGITTQQFLGEYGVIEWEEGDFFPRVYLGMQDDGQVSCPFVTDQGCNVYDGRPGPCRTYPLGRGAYQLEDGSYGAMHVVLHEPHCHGFAEKDIQSVAKWTEGQELHEYNRMNDAMIAILHHPDTIKKKPTLEQRSLFLDTLYDLDTFRGRGKIVDADRLTDEEFLLAAINWLKLQLFGFFKF